MGNRKAWTIQESIVQAGDYYIKDHKGSILAEVQRTNVNDNAAARAMLLRAAPELLEALKRLLAAMNGQDTPEGHRELDAAEEHAQATLAKATGASK